MDRKFRQGGEMPRGASQRTCRTTRVKNPRNQFEKERLLAVRETATSDIVGLL
jgi:hypothetical protein